MLISHSHRFIFIHVGKSAGMSIRDALTPFCEEPDKFRMRRPPKLKGDQPNPMYTVWETLLLHPRGTDIERALPAGMFDSYHKFGFVRNPWDLLVSLYHFMLSDPAIPRHAEVAALADVSAFIDWSVREAMPFPKGITKLQADMLTGMDGKLLVDDIGHYETLHEDFGRICRHVGIDAELPHLNRSHHRDYRTYYTDRTRALVAEHFHRDIAMFGYNFDGWNEKAA
jgi:hypothetical protein